MKKVFPDSAWIILVLSFVAACAQPANSGQTGVNGARLHLLSKKAITSVASAESTINMVQQGLLLFSDHSTLLKLNIETGAIQEVFSASVPAKEAFMVGDDIIFVNGSFFTVPASADQTTELWDFASPAITSRYIVTQDWVYFVENNAFGDPLACRVGRVSSRKTADSRVEWLFQDAPIRNPLLAYDGTNLYISNVDPEGNRVNVYRVDPVSGVPTLLTALDPQALFPSKTIWGVGSILLSPTRIYLNLDGARIVELDKAGGAVMASEERVVVPNSEMLIGDQLYFISDYEWVWKFQPNGSVRIGDKGVRDLQPSGASSNPALTTINGSLAVITSADVMDTATNVYTYDSGENRFLLAKTLPYIFPFRALKYQDDDTGIRLGTGDRFSTFFSKKDFTLSTNPFGYLPYDIYGAYPVGETQDSLIAVNGFGPYTRMVSIPKGGSVSPTPLPYRSDRDSVVDAAYKDGTFLWISRSYEGPVAFSVFTSTEKDLSRATVIQDIPCTNTNYNNPKSIYLSDDDYIVQVETLTDQHWFLYDRKTNSLLCDLSQSRMNSEPQAWGNPLDSLQNMANVGGTIYLGTSSGLYSTDTSGTRLVPLSNEKIRDVTTINGLLYWISDSGLFRIAADGQVEQLFQGLCYSLKGDLHNLFVVSGGKIMRLILD